MPWITDTNKKFEDEIEAGQTNSGKQACRDEMGQDCKRWTAADSK
jgi:hypothetical protein